MKEVWSKSWKKVLIWACGYVSMIAFAIAGGYAIIKGDEETKRSAKYCFIVTLIFLAINAFVSILSSINSLSYSADFSTFLRWLNFIILIAEIAVYAAAIVITLVTARGKSEPASSGTAEGKSDEKEDSEGKKE